MDTTIMNITKHNVYLWCPHYKKLKTEKNKK